MSTSLTDMSCRELSDIVDDIILLSWELSLLGRGDIRAHGFQRPGLVIKLHRRGGASRPEGMTKLAS